MHQPGQTQATPPSGSSAPANFYTPDPTTGLPYGDVAQAFDAMFGTAPAAPNHQFQAPGMQPGQFQVPSVPPGQFQAPIAQPQFQAPGVQPGQFQAPIAQPQFQAPGMQPGQFQTPLTPPGFPQAPAAPTLDIAQDIIMRYGSMSNPQPTPQQQTGMPQGAPQMQVPPVALPPLPPAQPGAPAQNPDALTGLAQMQAQQTEILAKLASQLQPAAPAPAAPASPIDFDPQRDQLTPQEHAAYAEAMPVVQKLVKQALANYHERAQSAVVAPLRQNLEQVTAQLTEARAQLSALGANVEQSTAQSAEVALFTGLDPQIVAHVRARSPHYQAALRSPIRPDMPGFTIGDAMKTALGRGDIQAVQGLLRQAFNVQQPPQPQVTAPQSGAPLQPPGTPQPLQQPSFNDFQNLQAAQLTGKIAPDMADRAMGAMFQRMLAS